MSIINHKVFPSIITEIKCLDFVEIKNSLIEWVYNYQQTDNGVTFTNRGGWQSSSNFYKQDSFLQYFNYIQTYSLSAIQFYNCNLKITNMWININKKGNYNVSHVHPGSLISGIFWVKIPQNCGKLKFLSPNHFNESHLVENVNNKIKLEHNYCDHFDMNPQEGKIILFPSHLRHLVEPNKSDEDRISIAFNLNI